MIDRSLNRMNHPRWVRGIFVVTLFLAVGTLARGQGVLTQWKGDATGEFAGAAVAGVGDVDQDGNDDVAIGCPGDPGVPVAGRVVIRSGADGSILIDRSGAEGDRLGTSIARIGDVNGDGYSDIAVGANQLDGGEYQGHRPGYVLILSGGDLSGEELFVMNGNTGAEAFGQCVRAAGDVDLDGVPDLIIGAPGASTNGSGSGRAVVISGKTGGTIHEFFGAAAGDWLGYAVDGAADFDGDGCPDVLVGAYGVDGVGFNVGEVYVVSGEDGSIRHTLSPQVPNAWFGWAVAVIGDTDDDGLDDALVGSYFETAPTYATGAARVYSGGNGALRYAMTGDLVADLFGSSVAALPDVDGDGYADFAVGASEFCVPGFGSPVPDGRGYVRVFSGRDGDVIHTNRHNEVGSGFGDAIAHVGDVDGDGKPDLVVGAPGVDGGSTDIGSAFLLAVATGFLPGDDVVGHIGGGEELDSAVFAGDVG